MKICSFTSPSTSSASFTTISADYKYPSRYSFHRTFSWKLLRRGFLMKKRHHHPNGTNVQRRVNRNVCSSDRMLIRDIISLGSFSVDCPKNFSCSSRWSEIHSSTTSSGSDTGPSIYSPLPTSDIISNATIETANHRWLHEPKAPNVGSRKPRSPTCNWVTGKSGFHRNATLG